MRYRLIFVALVCFLVLGIDGNGVRKKRSAKNERKIVHDERLEKQGGRGLFERPDPEEAYENEDDDQDSDNDLGFPDDLFGNNGGSAGSLHGLRELIENFFQGFNGGKSNTSKPDEVEGPSNPGSLVSRLFGSLQPWWQGPNVCNTQEEYEEESADNNGFITAAITQCVQMPNAYKCTMKIGKDGKTKVKEVTHQCCHGWTREEGKSGCSKELHLQPLFDTLESLNLTEFVQSASAIKLQDRLGDGNYTLFVPTNKGMTTVNEKDGITAVVTESNDKLEFVRQILLGHVTSGWVTSADLADEQVLKTANNGSVIRINAYNFPRPFLTANCARIVRMDEESTNGIIHVIDRVMMPAKQTLAEIIQTHPQLGSMRALISEETMKTFADSNAHLTLFAFSDDAFDALPEATRTKIQKGDSCYKDLIREHIIPYTICSSAIQGEAAVQNIDGDSLNVTRDEKDVVRIRDATVVAADRVATNGVIHIIDKVLISDKMLGAYDALEKHHSKFTELAKKFDLESQIRAAGENITIFVPPNDALDQLAADYENDTESLKKTLLNHVAKGLVEFSADHENVVKTLAGQELPVEVRPALAFSLRGFGLARVNIQCATVRRLNVEACDGLMHFISSPLVIPKENVIKVLRGRPELSQFVMMLEAAKFESTLTAGNFSGTVLAPTNKGIEKVLGAKGIDDLLSKPDELKQFIQRHILTDQFCCGQLNGDFWFNNHKRALSGDLLPTFSFGDVRRVGAAEISSCDHLAENGVVHVIDRPIQIRRVRLGDLDMMFNGDFPFLN